MKAYSTEALRNIAVVGHGGVGKTTLSDGFLLNAKVTNRLGSVDDGTSLFDYDDEEKRRSLTIRATLATFEWRDRKINLLDTPGYDDFVGDVVGSLQVVDNALILIDAQSGVEVGTSRAWKYARDRHMPSFIGINKVDKEFSTFEKTYEMIRNRLGKRSVAVTIPVNEGAGFNTIIDVINMRALEYLPDASGKPKELEIPGDLTDVANAARERLIEQAAESDDQLLERYLEGNELTQKEILGGLKKGIAARTFFPVFAMASKPNVGLGFFLDVLAESGASPLDVPQPVSKDGNTKRKASESEPTSALAFKTVSEAHMGDLTFFRVFSGSLEPAGEYYNPRRENSERIGQLYFTQGHTRLDAPRLIAGDIGAAVKLKDTHAGDTLCEEGGNFLLPDIPFPKAVIRSAVEAVTQGDEDKIANGLHRLHEEDPTFHVEVSSEIKQTLIHGLGEMQLAIVVKRLKERFGVEVELIKPKIPYKETIRKSASGQGRYKKQTGGRGQYGDVWIRLEPKPRGEGFEFASEVVGGNIPTKFLPAVEKGIVQLLDDGVIAGCQVVDVKAIAYDGSSHAVDSSENSFKIAAGMAFRKVFVEADPILLEPIYIVKVTVPEECMGDVMGDLSSRRGKVLGMDAEGHYQIVKAEVPLSELYKYSTHLRSLTGGRGIHERDFDHYAEVPRDVAQKVIQEAEKEKEAEASH